MPLTKHDNAASPSSISASYQAVFGIAEQFEARGCCLIASHLETSTPQWAWQLSQPLFDEEADLVLPHYSLRKFQGLLNGSIIAPLLRPLYGKRINNPMGPDLAVSRRLFQKMLAKSGANNRLYSLHPLASLASSALCSNLQVMEVHFGKRIYPPADWKTVSSVLADVLTPVFLDVERKRPLLAEITCFGSSTRTGKASCGGARCRLSRYRPDGRVISIGEPRTSRNLGLSFAAVYVV